MSPFKLWARRKRPNSLAIRSSPQPYFNARYLSASDFDAQFDLALKNGLVVQPATFVSAWTPPMGGNGQPLPHAIGWFAQSYNGEPVVWQYGESATSSSMMITAPRRGLTLILLANSQGLVRSLNLSAGDISVSPFARVFLGIFLR